MKTNGTTKRTSKHKVARNRLTKTTAMTLNLDALVKRINTRLRTTSEMLRVARGKNPNPDLGRFYTVGMADRNIVLRTKLDVIKMGWDYQLLTDGMIVTEMRDAPFGKFTVRKRDMTPTPTPVNVPANMSMRMPTPKADTGRRERAMDRTEEAERHDEVEESEITQ